MGCFLLWFKDSKQRIKNLGSPKPQPHDEENENLTTKFEFEASEPTSSKSSQAIAAVDVDVATLLSPPASSFSGPAAESGKAIISATTLSSSYLPFDIVEMILLLLPSKSLARCKCVCKSWYDFIAYDDDFPNNHLRQSKKNWRNRKTFLWRSFSHSAFYGLVRYDNKDCKFEFEHLRPGDHYLWATATSDFPGKHVLCSADGLTLLTTSRADTIFMLLNPCRPGSGYLSIHTLIGFDPKSTHFGFFYSDGYKIVAICGWHYAVYSCKIRQWSSIKECTFPYLFLTYIMPPNYPLTTTTSKYGKVGGLFVDGFSFWIVKTRSFPHKVQIIYLDPRDEAFHKLQPPPHVEIDTRFCLTSLEGGCLCLYHNALSGTLRFWILLRDNFDDSSTTDSNSCWSKEFTVNINAGLGCMVVITPFFFTDNEEKDELMIHIVMGSKNLTGIYNFLDNKFEELSHSLPPCMFTPDSITVPCLDTCFFPPQTEVPARDWFR